MKRKYLSTNRESGFIGKYMAFVLKEKGLVYQHFWALKQHLFLLEIEKNEKIITIVGSAGVELSVL